MPHHHRKTRRTKSKKIDCKKCTDCTKCPKCPQCKIDMYEGKYKGKTVISASMFSKISNIPFKIRTI